MAERWKSERADVISEVKESLKLAGGFPGSAKDPRIPTLGLGLDGEARQRKERRPSGSGGRRRVRRNGDGCPDPLNYNSSDYQSQNGNGGEIGIGGSLFSPAGSVTDCCSFGSDQHDFFDGSWPESSTPVLAVALIHTQRTDRPLHLVSSPPLPEKQHAVSFAGRRLPPPSLFKVPPEGLIQRGQGEEGAEGDVEEEQSLDPSKRSFTHSPQECQSRRCGPETVALPGRKPQRQRPVSVDLKGQSADVRILSPGSLGAAAMNTSPAASSRSRPGTPNYRGGYGVVPYPKGLCSERVPMPAHSNRRYGGSSSALMLLANGRTLPSKWEDAERWLISPVSGDRVGRSSMPQLRYWRPKSKSGPIGAPAGLVGGTYSSASPLVPRFTTGGVGTFAANSPLLAGVLIPEGGFCGNGRGGKGAGVRHGGGIGVVGGGAIGGTANSTTGNPCIVRSASIHGCSDTPIDSSSSIPTSLDEKFGSTREEASTMSTSVLRKNVATQMSSDGSTPSSPEGPFSPSLASQPVVEGSHVSKLEIRDVQVDDRVTVTRWSKKHIAGSVRQPASIMEWQKTTVEANTSPWGVAETAKSISKHEREEAKITAWENLQKAKAEAEIRKLEMKLEKKRTSSMEKILSKLKLAQKKAGGMRNAAAASQVIQVTKTSKKVSHTSKNCHMNSLSGCFTCHSF